MTSAAFMGGALLMAAHFTALLTASFYRAIPVGLVTMCIGGVYFIYLLVRGARDQV
ncbi:hypothetical protein GCM10007304_43130 [Rhodococcoides trifolii]|uniref:Uncharacterized protein n=2 Tax=Rhodococcoides trifolii TaxID=908250 RepID=A0A917G6R4_9NOCA|nr:hypothetical protein GCM10007304_43130 [Rhodococcus trifolii]